MGDLLVPRLDRTRCTACGQCETRCPGKVVRLINRVPVFVHPEHCAYCGTCEEFCPTGALMLAYEIRPVPKDYPHRLHRH